MAITANEPNDVEQAYGATVITLTNSVSSQDRQILRIRKGSDDSLLADLRQLPNSNAVTHYNVNRILQSQVSMTPSPLVLTDKKLFTAPNECFDYYYEVGTINVAGTITIDATYSGSKVGNYLALPGRKEINSNGTTLWPDYETYVPDAAISYDGANYSIAFDRFQKALSDRNYSTIKYSDITDGKPGATDFPTADEDVYRIKIAKDQDYSLQFLNRWTGGGTSFGNGINYLRLQTYTDNTLVADEYIDNVVVNGGGNDISVGDDNIPTGSAGIIGVNCGFNSVNVTDAITHYYVWASAASSSAYNEDEDVRQSYAYRFDITDAECNDYDNPIEVRWLNSVGGIDYFNFRKKNEKQIRMKRDTFVAANQSWDSATFTQYPYERGETTFTQTTTETHTANTRYLSDAESTYLENLYRSPNVQVKFTGGSWIPVVLTSNTYTERNFRKDKLFQHTITFNLANNPISQGG